MSATIDTTDFTALRTAHAARIDAQTRLAEAMSGTIANLVAEVEETTVAFHGALGAALAKNLGHDGDRNNDLRITAAGLIDGNPQPLQSWFSDPQFLDAAHNARDAAFDNLGYADMHMGTYLETLAVAASSTEALHRAGPAFCVEEAAQFLHDSTMTVATGLDAEHTMKGLANSRVDEWLAAIHPDLMTDDFSDEQMDSLMALARRTLMPLARICPTVDVGTVARIVGNIIHTAYLALEATYTAREGDAEAHAALQRALGR